MEVLSEYVYKPLDVNRNETRVVSLKSLAWNRGLGIGNEIVVCDLELRQIDKDCDWTALSYTWGTGPEHGSIILAGQNRSVSPNLQQALAHIRHESQDVILWIDQLSINQDDDIEKGLQVQKMTSIYERAVRVISWIGMPENYSDVVFITLRHIANSYGHASNTILEGVIVELQAAQSKTREVVKWDRQKVLEALSTGLPALAMRQYWRRLWVLQEVVVASDLCVKCGAQEIEEHEFDVAWKRLGKTIQRPIADTRNYYQPTSDIVAIAQTWQDDFKWWDKWLGITRLMSRRALHQSDRFSAASQPVKESLVQVMYKTLTTFSGHVQMMCSDPRDRIFSLLGLSKDADLYQSFPDYGRTTESIYTEMTRLFLQQRRTDVLSFVQEDPSDRQRDMPSWAINWCHKIRILPWGKLGLEASQGTKFALDFSSTDEKSIAMSGVCVGSIKAHGERWPTDLPLSRSQTRSFLRDLRAFCAESRLIDEHETDAVCAQIAAPTALAHLHNKNLMIAAYDAFCADLAQSDASLYTESAEVLENVSVYEKELRLQLYRCPFITDSGYVGLGPAHVEVGDLICIFPHASAPNILRPAKTGDEFILAGGAHVHGIMKGEYFTVSRETQRFKLV